MQHTAQEIQQLGIYRITNAANGRIYIGSTMQSFRIRWDAHRYMLSKGTHSNKGLQADWQQYGEQAFVFEIVEVCPPGISKRDLCMRELVHLKRLVNTHNCMHYSLIVPATISAKPLSSMDYLSPQEIAQRLKITDRAVLDMIAAKKFDAMRVGAGRGVWRVSRASYERYVATQAQKSESNG